MGYKTLFCLKRLWKNALLVAKDVFATIGGLVMVAEASLEIFGYQGLFKFYQRYFLAGCITILAIAIAKNWDRLEEKVEIAGSPDITISLKVCDALKTKGALIIPTNTTFDTIMEDEFISKESLQGQYQRKYFQNRLLELDKKISEGLEGKQYTHLNDGRKSKENRYPIGTVCRISEKGKHVYFLADSDINDKGIPIDVDASDISKALVSLWEVLTTEGNQEPYSIPLIGTGKARAKNASRDEIVKEIILSFLAATKERKITEKLIICIHPNDLEKIHWDSLCEFLRYQCQYANLPPRQIIQYGTEERVTSAVALKDDCSSGESKYGCSPSYLDDLPLAEKEQKLLSLLYGNEMNQAEIAAAMGLSLATTTRLLNKLVEGGVVQVKGASRSKQFYIHQ